MSRPTLEICVEDIAGVRAAVAGGADRIELCSALALGGLTPSVALVKAAIALARPAGVAVHAMVRPRGGGFAYDADELALALAEASGMIAPGVDGLVFGAARGGRLDEAALARFVDMARRRDRAPSLTLHRAIDTLDDPVAAVDIAVALGFDRILTSGGAPTAIGGVATIRAMVERARGHCRIMAGAGVRPDNAAALIAAGADDLHGSASHASSASDDRSAALGFGTPPRRTDTGIVRTLRNIVDNSGKVRTT